MCDSPRSDWSTSSGGSRRADAAKGAERISQHRFWALRLGGFWSTELSASTKIRKKHKASSSHVSPPDAKPVLPAAVLFVSRFKVILQFLILLYHECPSKEANSLPLCFLPFQARYSFLMHLDAETYEHRILFRLQVVLVNSKCLHH